VGEVLGGDDAGCVLLSRVFVDETVWFARDLHGDRAEVLRLLRERVPSADRVSVQDAELAAVMAGAGLVLKRSLWPMVHRLRDVPHLPPRGAELVRPMEDADVEPLARVLLRAYPPGTADEFVGGFDEAVEEIRLCLGDPVNPVLAEATKVVVRDGGPVALALVWDCTEPPDEGPFLAHVFRDPLAIGAGSVVLSAVLQTLRDLGRDHLRLSVTEANDAARRAYLRLGFESGPLTSSYLMP
jgi:hypothetical protein